MRPPLCHKMKQDFIMIAIRISFPNFPERPKQIIKHVMKEAYVPPRVK